MIITCLITNKQFTYIVSLQWMFNFFNYLINKFLLCPQRTRSDIYYKYIDHINISSRKQIRDHDHHQGTRFMEKCSYDPREYFKESMIETIMANRIEEAKDLRSLLNYYMSMNSMEYHGIILEVFYEVCSNLFPFWKCYWWRVFEMLEL